MLKNNKLKAVKQVLKFEYHLVKKRAEREREHRERRKQTSTKKFSKLLAPLSTFIHKLMTEIGFSRRVSKDYEE